MKCVPCKRTYRAPEGEGEERCKQCGELLTEEAAVQAAAQLAHETKDRKRELREANAELKRWRKRQKALKAYFIIGPGIIYAMLAAAAGLALLSEGAAMMGAIVLSVAFLIAAGSWYLAWLSDQKPVFASLCCAGFTTLSLVSTVFVLGTSVPPLRYGFAGLICFAAWFGVAQARSAERLRATIPEVYRRKQGLERAQLEGESVREKNRTRSKARGRGELVRAALIVGLLGLVVSGAAFAFWKSEQPNDPGPTLHSFMLSWADGDLEGFALHASSERIERGLRLIWKRNGWSDAPPPLTGWDQTKRTEDKVLVSFLVDGGLVSKTRWEWSGERWALHAFVAPK